MKDREVDESVASADGGDTDSGDGRTVLQVECGLNKAVLHLDRLCQGSKGACILFEETWMTPNEFQAASGRETAKDWKRSIKHHDKSLKLLIVKGFLFVDPPVCKCEHCVPSSATESSPPPPSPPPVLSATAPKVRMLSITQSVAMSCIWNFHFKKFLSITFRLNAYFLRL